MQSYLNEPVAHTVIADRHEAARSSRAQQPARGARSPGRARRSVAAAAVRLGRRLDADSVQRAM